MQEERRKGVRHRVLKGATIAFGGSGIDCTVHNLSDYGAALDVASQIGIPEAFTLITHEGDVHRPCRVAWRKGQRLGIVFVG